MLLFTGFIPGGDPSDRLNINAGGRGIYHCPSDSTGWVTYNSAKFHLSYGRNLYLGAYANDANAARIFKVTQVRNPTEALLYSDNYGRNALTLAGVNSHLNVKCHSRLCLPINYGADLGAGFFITGGVHQNKNASSIMYYDCHASSIHSSDRSEFNSKFDNWNN